jgi:hypothetical protein
MNFDSAARIASSRFFAPSALTSLASWRVLVFFLFLLMIGANEVHAQDNTPPDLAPIGDRSVNEGNLLTFTATASDDPGDTLTFSLDAGAPRLALARESFPGRQRRRRGQMNLM